MLLPLASIQGYSYEVTDPVELWSCGAVVETMLHGHMVGNYIQHLVQDSGPLEHPLGLTLEHALGEQVLLEGFNEDWIFISEVVEILLIHL